MATQRTRDLKRVSGQYKRKFRWSDRCVYCGETATTLDHVLPVAVAATLDITRQAVRAELKQGLSLVPCCAECNGLAGARPFVWVKSKRAYIQGRIAKRYKRHDASVIWDEDELEELGPALRSTVISGMQKTDRRDLRVSWPNGRSRVSATVVRMSIYKTRKNIP